MLSSSTLPTNHSVDHIHTPTPPNGGSLLLYLTDHEPHCSANDCTKVTEPPARSIPPPHQPLKPTSIDQFRANNFSAHHYHNPVAVSFCAKICFQPHNKRKAPSGVIFSYEIPVPIGPYYHRHCCGMLRRTPHPTESQNNIRVTGNLGDRTMKVI